jgi:hypothetical protein
MINLSCSAAAMATSAVVQAARLLLSDLEHGRRVDAAGILRSAMESAFGVSDTAGAWHWKAACDAVTVLFLRKYAPSMRAKAPSAASMVLMLAEVASLLPTHTRCTEEGDARQQFSTPLPLGIVACTAAGITKTSAAPASSPRCSNAIPSNALNRRPGHGA